MIITESDRTNIMRLYEAINNPKTDAEHKLKLAYDMVKQCDPFFEITLFKMLPETIDKSIPTMCTDGKKLFYNPSFIDGGNGRPPLSAKAVFTVVVHEILHVAFGHHVAFAHIDPKNKNLWHLVNVACDLAINELIRNREGTIEAGLILAGDGKYADMPRGLDAKKYFERLIQKYTGEDKEEPKQEPKQGQKGQPQPSQKGEKGEKGEKSEQGEQGEQGAEGGDGAEGSEDASEGSSEVTQGSSKGGKPTGKGGKESTATGLPKDFSFSDFMKQAEETQQKAKERGKEQGKNKPKTQDEIEKSINVPEDIIKQYESVGTLKPAPNVTPATQATEIAKSDADREIAKQQSENTKESEAGYGITRNQLGVGDWRKSLEKSTSIDWGQILRQFMSTPHPDMLAYKGRGRGDEREKAGMPTQSPHGYKINEVCFLVDVSGSMSVSDLDNMTGPVVEKIFGEIASVGEALNGKCNARLVTFNTRIQSEHMFTSAGSDFPSIASLEQGDATGKIPDENVIPFNQMPAKFESFKFITTGGGTDITTTLTATRDLTIHGSSARPALVVVFTDGDFAQSEYRSLPSFTNDGMQIKWILTKRDTAKSDPKFNPSKYKLFNDIGEVLNLHDYTEYY